MNFEFMKSIDGLNKVYTYCNNAEELAKSMPYNSEFSARKSAETIAKYVYRVAHNEAATYLSFADILRDPIVKKYIGNREVIDAFHFVRKEGNRAVHEDDDISSEEAIEVLADLHFVVGEIACKMQLISDYPEFDENRISVTNVTECLDFDSDALAKEMYEDYVLCTHRFEKAKELLEEYKNPGHLQPGNVDEFEMIEFKHKPRSLKILRTIQMHFWEIAQRVLKMSLEETKPDDMNWRMELSVSGKKSYCTDNSMDALQGMLYDLDEAEGFTITNYYSGPSLDRWFTIENIDNVDISDALYDNCTYRGFEFLYAHNLGKVCKYINGECIDYKKDYSTDIIFKEFGEDWWTWDASLVIEFDFEKFGDIITALHEAVRRHVPAEELQYCECNWEGEEAEHEIILDGLNWCPKNLGEVQAFLDEVNLIIEPIKDECEYKFNATWYMTKAPFAIAELKRIGGEFKIVGTVL